MTPVLDKRTLTASQQAALARMPELANATFPVVRDSIAASTYIDPARFDAEMKAVFRALPIIAGPSAHIPNPGMAFQQVLAGMPVLVTRNREGRVRAFANVCTHRGAKLCSSEAPVQVARLVCPYHAWSFSLDGDLVGLPRQETFPGIDKKDHHLVELACAEAGGLIWVGCEPGRDYDFSLINGDVNDELNALGLRDMRVHDRATFPIKANWKLVMDTMLDSYHVTRLHKDSLARFFVDTENIIDRLGPHIRALAARGNFKRELISDDFNQVRQYMVFAYTLFPNGIIVCSPDFVSVGVMRPIATDRAAIDYFMLTDIPADDEKGVEKLRRSFALMDQAFGREDYWAAEQCDQGLRSGVLDRVHLGGMEVQIAMFHNAVNERLAAMAAQQEMV